MKKNNKKGFTIVELVIVIAVIGILAAVLIPTFANVTKSAKDKAALQDARNEYVEYCAETPAALGGNYIVVTDNGAIAIVAGQIKDDVVYADKAAALAAFAAGGAWHNASAASFERGPAAIILARKRRYPAPAA